MNKGSIFVADPYNEKHIQLIKDFEDINKISKRISNKLEDISNNFSKIDYIKDKKNSNNVEEVLFEFNGNNINDYCYIVGKKDLKNSTLYFPQIKDKKPSEKLILESINYTLNILNMETIFIMVKSDNKQLISTLEKLSFENLGEDNKYITYMIEKTYQKEKGRTI